MLCKAHIIYSMFSGSFQSFNVVRFISSIVGVEQLDYMVSRPKSKKHSPY